MNKRGMKPDRLKRIKDIIDLLSDGPLTQPEIGGITGLSNGGVRKNMIVLTEAKLLDVKRENSRDAKIYSLTKNKAFLEQYTQNLNEQICIGEAAQNKDKPKKEEIPVVIGLRFAHHLVAPGRTIYRALDNND